MRGRSSRSARSACGCSKRSFAGANERYRGDFHTGNVRWTDAGPVIFDWGDCGIGNPLLDLPPFDRNLAAEDRPAARSRWIEQWTIKAPGSDAARAVALIEPIAALRLAVIFQAFLDGIEQTERRYHEADVPEQLREAARRAIEELPLAVTAMGSRMPPSGR